MTDRLAARALQEAPAKPEHETTPMLRRFSVLLAEDDDPLRASLVELFAAEGWKIHPTGRGSEAVELARREPVDFSILDLHLEGMTGLDVLRALQREGRILPSIMMSGKATESEAQEARRHGVFTFLYKPLDLSELRASVDGLIRHHFGGPPTPTGFGGP